MSALSREEVARRRFRRFVRRLAREMGERTAEEDAWAGADVIEGMIQDSMVAGLFREHERDGRTLDSCADDLT